MNLEVLIEKAKEARLNAYSPYSNFQVGCALLAKSGKVYTGCNIENGGIQAICSERVAFTKALSDGEREFECMVVVGGSKDGKLGLTTPCGYCRQFINEFVDDNFKIYAFYDTIENIQTFTISELLPSAFKL